MNFRKIIATLVSMVMLVGIMPTMVFADDETAETSETTIVSEQETPTVIEEETEQSQETAAETQETTVETSAETTGETTVETGTGDITIPASNANEDVVTHTVTLDYGFGTVVREIADGKPLENPYPGDFFPDGYFFGGQWFIVNSDGSVSSTPFTGNVTSDMTLRCQAVSSYINTNGSTSSMHAWVLNSSSSDILTEDCYVVFGEVNLANTRFTVSRSAGPVNIILASGSKLVCSGITVEGSNSLNIWGCERPDADPTGRLVINNVSGVSAGIGSTGTNSSGAITINGGKLEITGGANAPAIGCDSADPSGAITINNGTITCNNNGSDERADHAIIGGTSVTINGGKVTVNGSSVSGSEVVALGGDYQTASVSITGGDVSVNDTAYGIGGNSVSITGGNVAVSGVNGHMTAGIIGNSITLNLNNTLSIDHSEIGIKSLDLGSIAISGSDSGLIRFGGMPSNLTVAHPFAGTVIFNTPYTDDEQILYGTYNNAEESIRLLAYELSPVTRPIFSGHSIVLNEGLIGVNFTVCIPSGYSIPNVINYTVNESEPQVAMNTKSDGVFFTYTCYVSSTQMAETVSASFDCADQTYTDDYSVVQYVNEVLSHRDSYSEQVVNLVQAIADYGYYAQAYMQEHNSAYRRTSHAAMPEEIRTVYDDDLKQAAETGLSRYGVSVSGIPTGIRMTYSLVFDSSTSLRLYVRSNDAISSVTGNGEVTKLSDSAYMIEIEGIAAQRLGSAMDTIRLTVETEAGSNTITVDLAPLAYVNALYGTSDTGTDLAVAFYRYYEAVRAIRGN